jgi:hypothetical protein
VPLLDWALFTPRRKLAPRRVLKNCPLRPVRKLFSNLKLSKFLSCESINPIGWTEIIASLELEVRTSLDFEKSI